jgi:hypothetical protein
MWRIARLALVAAMLIAAYGTIGDGTTSTSPHVVPLARIDGWTSTRASAQPLTHLVVAYDAASAAKLWTATRVVRDARHGGPAGEYGVYADLGSVDFSRQAVVVLESAGSSSCPTSLVDVRPLTAGAVELVTTARPEGFCTADLHAFTEFVAVDRDLLPAATGLASTRVLVDGTRIDAVRVATPS